MKELIRAQERAATSQAEELLLQLEQEIAELKKRDAELSQLAQTENQISFLQVEHPSPASSAVVYRSETKCEF